MKYDMTLLRFMLLTSQDQDVHGSDAVNWLAELSHWFDATTVESHERLLFEARLLTPPGAAGAERRPHLTRAGARVADYLRDERDWRFDIAVPGDVSDTDFRERVARALRRKRRRTRPAAATWGTSLEVKQYWSL